MVPINTVTSRLIVLLIFLFTSVVSYGQSSTYRTIRSQEEAFHQRVIKPVPSSLDGLYAAYDVKYYKLDLQLGNDTSYIAGTVYISALVTGASLDTFALELVPQMQIDTLKINGIQNNYSRTGDTVFIFLNPIPSPGSILNLSITYHGTPPANGFFSGLSSAYYPLWQSHVTWSLSEPWMAKEWWPCKQDLKDKADSIAVSVTTDVSNKAGSNGLLKAVVSLPGNKVRYDWKSSYPIDYYLISIAVGPYMDYSIYAKPDGLNDSILVQNYLFDVPGCLQQYKTNIDKTPVYIELFSKLFGMYPFYKEKYGHCLAYLGGAMEHQTMTTTGDFGLDLISHELTHQWFGDNVTCASWKDIWLNEGFATYGTYLARQYTENQASANNFMQGIHDIVLSGPGGSVYIPDSEVGNVSRIFDGRLSYNKGAAILHMLRFELNDDSLFFHILRQYELQYGNGTAIGIDFKGVAESLSGKNLDDYFTQWYFGEGYPTYFINYLKSGDSLYLRSSQTPSSSVTSLFKMTMEFRILFTGGDTTIRVYQDQAMQHFVIPFIHDVTGVVVDPSGSCILKVGGIQQGINENTDLIDFQVFPNPASNILNINIVNQGNAIHEYFITDLSGRKVRQFSTNKSRVVINIADLASGVYVIRTEISEIPIRRMFIKN